MNKTANQTTEQLLDLTVQRVFTALEAQVIEQHLSALDRIQLELTTLKNAAAKLEQSIQQSLAKAQAAFAQSGSAVS